MSKLKHQISIFIFAASVVGLLLSMVHYHNVSLDCLEHQGEAHYTEYVLACPVCALTVNVDSDHSLQFKALIEFKEYVFNGNDRIPHQISFDSPLGRSPPPSLHSLDLFSSPPTEDF